MRRRRYSRVSAQQSSFVPPEVITLATCWYLRFVFSYRDLGELLAKRGIEVDHVSVPVGAASARC